MSHKLKSIAVYCGSNPGQQKAYSLAAENTAEAIVAAGLTLIYGGAKVGLMGVLANTVLAVGGKAVGVIPQSLVDHEVAHDGLTSLHVVKTMHERKALIADLADAFIMLPGGPGSWEEFFEIMTWSKLGHHQKPSGILNINHYYDNLLKFMDHAVDEQFLHSDHRDMIIVADSPQGLLQKFFTYEAPSVSAWMDKLEITSC